MSENKQFDNTTNNLSNFEILVAEDEPANFQLVTAMLKKTGIKISWAKTGKEAVQYVEQSPSKFFAVLMDIKMPVMDGVTAYEHIKKLNRDLPVIALTAYAFQNEKTEILKHGFADYLTKPIKPGEILESLKKISLKNE